MRAGLAILDLAELNAALPRGSPRAGGVNTGETVVDLAEDPARGVAFVSETW